MSFPEAVYEFFVNQLPDFVFGDILPQIWRLYSPTSYNIGEEPVFLLFQMSMALFFINRISRLIKRLY